MTDASGKEEPKEPIEDAALGRGFVPITALETL
jgi:hypothetical protein